MWQSLIQLKQGRNLRPHCAEGAAKKTNEVGQLLDGEACVSHELNCNNEQQQKVHKWPQSTSFSLNSSFDKIVRIGKKIDNSSNPLSIANNLFAQTRIFCVDRWKNVCIGDFRVSPIEKCVDVQMCG